MKRIVTNEMLRNVNLHVNGITLNEFVCQWIIIIKENVNQKVDIY